LENRDRLSLFEGIIIGIYGNWLISLLDKISFTKVTVIFDIVFWWYQPTCMILSFSCLILLVFFSIFRPHLVTRRLVFTLATGHFVGNYAGLWAEGFTIKTLFFLLIGTFLFFILYFIEIERMRIGRREYRS